MDKKQFVYSAEKKIFSEVAKGVNQLCGLSKTSSMIANLLVNLPLQVEARFIQYLPKPSKKLNALDEFVHAYTKHDDGSKVYIAFFYSDEKYFKRIMKGIEKHPEFFVYLYMREALKIVRLMNTKTHYSMMSGIIKHNNPSIELESHYRLSQRACSYVINDTIKKLFESSQLSNKFNTIIEGQLYKSKYAGMSETEVVKDLIEIDPTAPATITKLDPNFSYDELANEVFDCADNPIDANEELVTDLGESISTHLALMSKDGASASVFAEFFTAKKVKTGWFKKLTAKFSTDVYNMTNTFRSEWTSLKVTYRHKFKAPNTKYEDNKLSVILSIDHSGSMSTEALSKLLYIIEKHSKKIAQLFVLIHDVDIVKEVKLEHPDDIASDLNFDVLKSRIAVGGTSHYKVLQRIEELIVTKKVNPEKTLYISCSDNYSDIPESWKACPKVSKLFSVVWLSPVNNPVNIRGTSDISMQ